MNAQEMQDQLNALSLDDAASTLARLRELLESLDQLMTADRHSQSGIAVALMHQAVNYICEGIEGEQNGPEIKRRFAIAIRRAAGWAMASAKARADDPRLGRGEVLADR